MITMVPIFTRSARVAAASPESRARSWLAQAASAAIPNARSKRWRARTRSTDFMRASIEACVVARDRSSVTPTILCQERAGLESPGRADRHRVRVTELGADALVLGTK